MANTSRPDKQCGVIAFGVDAELLASADAAAAQEGISRSDIARRALKRDLQRNSGEVVA